MRFKSSTFCAVASFFVLAVCVVANLAGCGGGSGGGGLGSGIPTSVTANFSVLRSNGSVATGGTVALTKSGATVSSAISSTGRATFTALAPGTYSVTVTITSPLAEAARTFTLMVAAVDNQTYTLRDGLSISGKLFLNSPDDSTTANCTTSSTPLTASVILTVIDISSPTVETPTIATVTRAVQDPTSSTAGEYVVSVPYVPSTFQILVKEADSSGVVFTGSTAKSSTTTNVNGCVNRSSTGPTVGPTATPTTTSTAPTATPTTVATTAGLKSR